MTKYNIAGEEVTITTEVENERYVRKNTSELIANAGSIFDNWYSAQGDCNSVYRNSDAVLEKAIMPLVNKGLQMISDQGVYSLDEKIFVNKYASNALDEFCGALEVMQDKIEEIDDQQQQNKEYRQMRKANRGRVIGGGFGLGGALKGMATAGVLNATTGMAHSLANAAGNMGSSIAASASKSGVYRDSKAPLRKAFIQTAYDVRNGIRDALGREANVKCKYVTSTESDQSDAIVKNYQQGKIPSSSKKGQIIQALLLNPYDTNIYEIIWNDFGDKNGDLRKLSSYFDCGLDNRIKALAEKYGNEVFSTKCKDYEVAYNKPLAAIENESNIKETLEELKKYSKDHDIQEELIPCIQTCKQLLEQINSELLSVHGITYESRELAEKIRKDYDMFYLCIFNKDIYDPLVCKEVAEVDYSTDEFKGLLNELIDKEKERRNPEKIYENILNLVNKKVKKEIISEGWIEIGNVLGNLQNKEALIRNITGMSTDEIPLLLIDRSSNGKKGVLITNLSLRIYAKGIFSNDNQRYPIEDVKEIQNTGSDEYSIILNNQDNIKVELKHNKLSAEEQFSLGDTLSSTIRLICNLSLKDRNQLNRIIHSIAKCVCGSHLIPGDTFCPDCGKTYTENGGLLETQVCPVCGAVIPKDTKRCSQCGTQLIIRIPQTIPEIRKEVFTSLTVDNEQQNQDVNQIKPQIISHQQAEDVIISQEKETEKNGEVINNVLEEYILCPTCGNKENKGKQYCSRCGASIGIEEKIKCLNCGKMINRDTKYCNFCGELSPAFSVICPNCNKRVKLGTKFCNYCGERIVNNN